METTIAGRKVEYGVDEKGIFKARYNGENYEHVTLAGLKSALERQMKKAPLKIPVVKIEYLHYDKPGITKGVIVGVHSGNRNLLIKWDDEDHVEQHRDFRELLVASVDLKKLRTLRQSKRKAEEALDAFLQKNRFDRSKIEMDANAE
jgi:hypothetical protein